MSEEERIERNDATLKARPTVRELGDGSFRVEKAGIVGVGPTIEAAKFAVAFVHPPA